MFKYIVLIIILTGISINAYFFYEYKKKDESLNNKISALKFNKTLVIKNNLSLEKITEQEKRYFNNKFGHKKYIFKLETLETRILEKFKVKNIKYYLINIQLKTNVPKSLLIYTILLSKDKKLDKIIHIYDRECQILYKLDKPIKLKIQDKKNGRNTETAKPTKKRD